MLAVLIGGLGSAGGHLAASGAAALLEPAFSWRVLWLIGLPTGLVMALLSRFIPESPRFLILGGRTDEARRALGAYGAKLEVHDGAPDPADRRAGSTLAALGRSPYAMQTLGMLFGFAWGYLIAQAPTSRAALDLCQQLSNQVQIVTTPEKRQPSCGKTLSLTSTGPPTGAGWWRPPRCRAAIGSPRSIGTFGPRPLRTPRDQGRRPSWNSLSRSCHIDWARSGRGTSGAAGWRTI